MPTHRFPVLVWRDLADGYTAAPVEGDADSCGFGPTASAALDDLREYLQWSFAREPWQDGPDFLGAVLTTFKVPIRPEYETNHRVYPCEQPITVRVHCVHGRQESGLLVASLPVVGVRFYYHDAEQLKSLAHRYVSQRLEGRTPEELARFLPPTTVELDEVVVRVPHKPRSTREAVAPPALGTVAEALGDRAIRRQFSPAWEREREVATLVRKLTTEKANVLVVGESGVGKSAVIIAAVKLAELQLQATDDKAPKRRFWQTSGARLIAGMKYLGQWEERVERVISELGQFDGILCVDRLLDLVRTGGIDATDSVASFLLPFLHRGELRLVGEATPAELDACRRLLPGFADVFQIVTLEPFLREPALRVLDRLFAGLSTDMHLTIQPGTADRVYQSFRRFAPYSAFPGQAVGFARELAERAHKARRAEVTPNDAIELFMQRTGLPERFLRDEVQLDRADVLAEFQTRVIDQPHGARAAADLVTTFKAGLNDPSRPVGVFLFCGPTGVGKTEMANALAGYFFGGGSTETKRMIRLDMSEYGSFDAVERLLGPANGDPGELIRRVRQQPFVVVLLDEIEKAHPAVFDVLMGVFDEGRLTDRFGRVTNFRSAIIVMTSNLGAGKAGAFGFDGTNAAPDYRHEAMQFFRPEFFNRLDGVVTFEPLRPATVRTITEKELSAIGRREGLVRSRLTFRWGQGLVDHIAKIGFDALYGARPLQRAVEREVVAPLAKFLLERRELFGAAIRADYHDGAVSFIVE